MCQWLQRFWLVSADERSANYIIQVSWLRQCGSFLSKAQLCRRRIELVWRCICVVRTDWDFAWGGQQKCPFADDVIRRILSVKESWVNTFKISKEAWRECMDCEKTIWSGRRSEERKRYQGKSRILWSARKQRKKVWRIPAWLLSGLKQLENMRQSFQLLILFVTTLRCGASFFYNGRHKRKVRSRLDFSHDRSCALAATASVFCRLIRQQHDQFSQRDVYLRMICDGVSCCEWRTKYYSKCIAQWVFSTGYAEAE